MIMYSNQEFLGIKIFVHKLIISLNKELSKIKSIVQINFEVFHYMIAYV